MEEMIEYHSNEHAAYLGSDMATNSAWIQCYAYDRSYNQIKETFELASNP